MQITFSNRQVVAFQKIKVEDLNFGLKYKSIEVNVVPKMSGKLEAVRKNKGALQRDNDHQAFLDKNCHHFK